MIDKIMASAAAAVAGIKHGSTVLIGGFGTAGMPFALIDALIAQGAGELVIVSNNAGNGDTGLAALLKAGRVRKVPDEVGLTSTRLYVSSQPGASVRALCRRPEDGAAASASKRSSTSSSRTAS